jgi:hypothetical protein
MVCRYGLRNTKSSNIVIEHEKRSGGVIVGKGRKCLDQFSEVVNNHDEVVMTISRGRLTCHEINPPFGKGTNINNWM